MFAASTKANHDAADDDRTKDILSILASRGIHHTARSLARSHARSFARLIPLGQEGTKMSTKTTASAAAGGRAATVVARKDGQNGSRCLLMQREELDEKLRQLLKY